MTDKNKKDNYEEKKGVQSIQNQLNESYQKGVVEDQLKNNKGINTFNNQSK